VKHGSEDWLNYVAPESSESSRSSSAKQEVTVPQAQDIEVNEAEQLQIVEPNKLKVLTTEQLQEHDDNVTASIGSLNSCVNIGSSDCSSEKSVECDAAFPYSGAAVDTTTLPIEQLPSEDLQTDIKTDTVAQELTTARNDPAVYAKTRIISSTISLLINSPCQPGSDFNFTSVNNRRFLPAWFNSQLPDGGYVQNTTLAIIQ